VELEGSHSCVDAGTRVRALVQNDLAVMAAMDGRFDEARTAWQTALKIDRDGLVARLNRDLFAAGIHRDQATEVLGELKLAPAPMPSPLGEKVARRAGRGDELTLAAPPHPPFGHPLPVWGEGDDSARRRRRHSQGARAPRPPTYHH
jgi:hypothetical protein